MKKKSISKLKSVNHIDLKRETLIILIKFMKGQRVKCDFETGTSSVRSKTKIKEGVGLLLCLSPGSNWGPLVCETSVITNYTTQTTLVSCLKL